MATLTIQEALRRASSLLKESSPTYLLDARVLLGAALDRDAGYLYAHGDRELTAGEEEGFFTYIRRRQAREPVAYIVGEKEFMGLPLRVTPAVLIPRPETEVLVEAALTSLSQKFPSPSPLHLLDIGTGSGAIALSLAFYRPDARVTAVDFSEAALRVARENAHRLGLTQRINFVQADLFPPAPGSFHLIISNPPYIPTGELCHLPADVGRYEPHQALDGGADGLFFYRRLLPPPPSLLARKGIMALEVGEGQADSVQNLFPGARAVKIIKDYAGLDRVVLFETP